MIALLIRLVIFVLLSARVLVHGEYVSTHGRDDVNCGVQSNPCRTIAFLLSKIKKATPSDDLLTIFMDGGKDKYKISSTIDLFSRSNVVIKKNSGSVSNPIIDLTSNTFYAFGSSNNLSIKFQDIDFVGEKVLTCNSNKICSVTFESCVISKERDGNTYQVIKSTAETVTSIKISKSILKNVALFLTADTQQLSSLAIKSSKLIQSYIVVKSDTSRTLGNVHINISDSEITKLSSPFLRTDENFTMGLVITNSRFFDNQINSKELDLIETSSVIHTVFSMSNVIFTRNSLSAGLFSLKNSSNISLTNVHLKENSFLGNTAAAITFKYSVDITLAGMVIVGNEVKGSMFSLRNSSNFSASNLEFKENTMSINNPLGDIHDSKTNTVSNTIQVEHSKDISFENITANGNSIINGSFINLYHSFNHSISNLVATDNVISSTVLSAWFCYLELKDTFITRNRYHTGFSITNSDAVVDGLHIADNIGSGSTKEFYFAEYYEFDQYRETKDSVSHCWEFLERVLVFSNINITTSIPVPDQKRFYAVSLYLLLPKVKMRNVTINLKKHQTAGFEMFVNNRYPESFRPDFRINCPIGASVKQSKDTSVEMTFKYQIYCQPCEKNLYSVEYGSLYINNLTTQVRHIYYKKNPIIGALVVNSTTPITCRKCSVGGDCRDGLSKSRGNFYGYRPSDNDSLILYEPCPSHYCCSVRDNTPCLEMNTCMRGRGGILCGKCQPGYQENFFNTSCILTRNCQKRTGFWFVYIITVYIIFVVICFLDLLGPALRKVITLIKRLLKKLRKRTKTKAKSATLECGDQREKYDNKETKDLTYRMITLGSPTAKSDLEEIGEMSVAGEINQSLEQDNDVIDNDNKTETMDKIDNHRDDDDTEAKRTVPESEFGEFQKHIVDDNEIVENDGYVQKNFVDSPSSMVSTNKIATLTKNATSKHITITIENNKTFTAGGLFQAFVSFYQIRSLIHVNSVQKYSFTEVMSDIFNGGLFFNYASTFCPYVNLGVVDKIFIRYVVFFIFMLVMLLLMAIAYSVYRCLIKETEQKKVGKKLVDNLSMKQRLEVCYSRIMIFNFKNLAFFSFVSLNCTGIDNTKVLFINGTIQCFQYWQYIVMVFVGIWLIPFPIALYQSFQLYQRHRITYHEKMICLTCPLATIWYSIIRYNTHSILPNQNQFDFVQKMYVEPYRLIKGKKDKYIFWEHWRLLQRLILSSLSVFLNDPLVKVTAMVPCIIIFTAVYIKLKPFNKQFTLLHWLEVTSLMGYFFIIKLNLCKSFLYVYDITDTAGIDNLIKIFSYSEILFSPLAVIIIYVGFNMAYKKFVK